MKSRKQNIVTPIWGNNVVAHIQQLKLIFKELTSLLKVLRTLLFITITTLGAPQIIELFGKFN